MQELLNELDRPVREKAESSEALDLHLTDTAAQNTEQLGLHLTESEESRRHAQQNSNNNSRSAEDLQLALSETCNTATGADVESRLTSSQPAAKQESAPCKCDGELDKKDEDGNQASEPESSEQNLELLLSDADATEVSDSISLVEWFAGSTSIAMLAQRTLGSLERQKIPQSPRKIAHTLSSERKNQRWSCSHKH